MEKLWVYLFCFVIFVMLFELVGIILIQYEHNHMMDLFRGDIPYYIMLDVVGYMLIGVLICFIKIEKTIQKGLEQHKDL